MCGTTLMFIKFKNTVPGVSMGLGVYFVHSAVLYIRHIFSGGFRGGGCSPPSPSLQPYGVQKSQCSDMKMH